MNRCVWPFEFWIEIQTEIEGQKYFAFFSFFLISLDWIACFTYLNYRFHCFNKSLCNQC